MLPDGAQPQMFHTATALSSGPGRTQVNLFGGCPKFERGKSDDAQQKLANTTVLEFGKQNVHMTLALIQLSEACYWWLIHSSLLFSLIL